MVDGLTPWRLVAFLDCEKNTNSLYKTIVVCIIIIIVLYNRHVLHAVLLYVQSVNY